LVDLQIPDIPQDWFAAFDPAGLVAAKWVNRLEKYSGSLIIFAVAPRSITWRALRKFRPAAIRGWAGFSANDSSLSIFTFLRPSILMILVGVSKTITNSVIFS